MSDEGFEYQMLAEENMKLKSDLGDANKEAHDYKTAYNNLFEQQKRDLASLTEAKAEIARLKVECAKHKADAEMYYSNWNEALARFPTTAQIMVKMSKEMDMEQRILSLTQGLEKAKEAIRTAGSFTAYDSEADAQYPFSESLAYQDAMKAITALLDKTGEVK